MMHHNKTFLFICIFALLLGLLSMSVSNQRYQQAKLAEEQIGEAVNMLSENLTQIEENLNTLDIIYQTAESYNLPPELLLAMMKVESNFDQYAVSSQGCAGLMQISPIHNVADVFDISVNVDFGASYISTLIKESEDLHEALGKYNRGQVGYSKFCKETNQRVTEYSQKITDYMNDLNGKTAD